MPQDQLRNAIDGLRARLQQELESQLSALTEQQDQAVGEARLAAEADAEQRWTAKLDEARHEWKAHLEAEVSTARAEAEQRFLAELSRVRTESERAAAEAAAQAGARARKEAEQAALRAAADARAQAEHATAEALAKVRSEAEQAAAELTARLRGEAEAAASQLAARLRTEIDQAVTDTASRVRAEADSEIESERQRSVALLDAERARSQSDLDAERKRASSLLDAERQRFDAERLQFRSERQRFEADRQHFALERQRFETAAKEYEAALHRPAPADEAVSRLETELAAERQRLAELDEALQRATESLQRVEAALEDERRSRAEEQAIHAEAMAAADEERASSSPAAAAPSAAIDSAMLNRVLAAMSGMDRARSLTEILDALVHAAGEEAPRAALFIAAGSHLQGLRARGFEVEIGSIRVAADAGLLGAALRGGEPVSAAASAGIAAPDFAQDAEGALAVPLAVGGEPVAILYADAGSAAVPVSASWPEAVQILGRHAASCLAQITASRTAQAMRLAPGATRGEDESSARRYARLLVSEIKLYNEAAVRAGREHRDLLDRLRPEISRARKLYEERVSAGAPHAHFEQELVQTLADGDPALLGEPA